MENQQTNDYSNKDLSKIINFYDQDMSDLDSEYSNARLTIINEIQKYNLKLIELEFTYKSEKMKLNEKRNKVIKNQLKNQKPRTQQNTEKNEKKHHIVV